MPVRPEAAGRRPPQPASARSFTSTFAALGALFVITFASQLAGASLPRWAAGQVDSHQMLWPQHWRFFAVFDAENIVVYRLDAAGAPAGTVLRPFNSPANLHGLSRHEYAVYQRVIELDRQVPASTWRTCAGDDLAGCVPPDGALVVLSTGAAPDSDLCGPLLFTHERAGTRGVVRAALVSIPCPR